MAPQDQGQGGGGDCLTYDFASKREGEMSNKKGRGRAETRKGERTKRKNERINY